ncbi:MAG: hypothetical protein E7329_11445 [Clostridiales bacterium]|nr:hypothetical protein [Clostridiales bacterium]
MAILFARDEDLNEYRSPVMFIHISKGSIHHHSSNAVEDEDLDFLLDQEVFLFLHSAQRNQYYIALDSLQALL